MHGYYHNATKTWLIVKPAFCLMHSSFSVVWVFRSLQKGRVIWELLLVLVPLLHEHNVSEKVELWLHLVDRLSEIIKIHPHMLHLLMACVINGLIFV